MRRSEDADDETFERYRRAVRDAIAASTLRAVAKSMGMSPTGLQKFLDGSNPYGKTRERLRYWYFRRVGFSAVAVEEAVYVLRRLMSTLPAPDHGVVELLDTVEAAHKRAGMGAPEWVQLIRNELGPIGNSSPHAPIQLE